MDPFVDKWESFGWNVKEVNGHSIKELVDALKTIPFLKNKPSVIIAHTVKGKGISFMESIPLWHYRLPNEDETKIVCEEMCMNEKELFE